MIKHTDEILLPVLDTDASAVPRYNVIGADGQTIYENVALRLANGVAQEGTPVNKPLLDEFLAASGVTAGSATAYTLAQDGYSLFDGAVVRFRLHTASGGNATLNINGTGAKPLRDTTGSPIQSGIPAGTWLTTIYSAPTGAYIFAAGSGGGSGVNLIDNWYLADPVNSRGQTEYTGAGYTINRWIAGVSENSVVINGDNTEIVTGGLRQFVQDSVIVPIQGKTVTVSALFQGSIKLTCWGFSTAYGTAESLDGYSLFTATFVFPSGSVSGRYKGHPYFENNSGTSTLKIKAVKLELGDKSTLAHQDADGNWVLNDPPPDKGMERLKCIQSTADPSDTYANKVIATTDYALNKAGDEMSGPLYLDDWGDGNHRTMVTTHDNRTHLRHEVDSNNNVTLMLSMEEEALLGVLKNGVNNNYNILHTGNMNDYITGSAKILSNTRITADSASLSIALPTDYTHFRIVMTEVATTDPSNGNVRGAFDVDSANMSNSGMQIAGNSSGTATATAVSMSNAAFLVTLADEDTFGSIVIDIVRYSGITQGTCRWATDGGGNNGNVNMGTTNFSAVGTPTSLTVTAMGGFALRQGMAIMVMGVK